MIRNGNEQIGTFKAACDDRLYGAGEIELDYTLYHDNSENLSGQLHFVRDNYKKMYDTVLENLHTAYKKHPTWDIWDEETRTPSRIEMDKKEDVHSYIGVPTVEIIRHEGQILIGLSFWRHNRMSIEHGFCAIFDKCNLLLIGDSDFENIIRFWDYRDEFNILN